MNQACHRSLLFVAGTFLTAWANALTCPAKTHADGLSFVRFPDQTVLVSGGLNVNPDGAAASYLPGDHGFTYIANGLALWQGGSRRDCTHGAANKECNAKFRDAEAKGFGIGTAEFCVFAIEVEALAPGGDLGNCTRGKVIGNGKGRLKIGGELDTATGGKTAFYASTTALNHTIDGKARPIDSSLVPAVVVPTSSATMIGRIAWVTYNGRGTFAVVGDTGPKYGEGSIALHQLLRDGHVTPQRPGPIAIGLRCSSSELSLRAPFESRPDKSGDTCKAGKHPTGAADIRAYRGIPAGVTQLVLGRARLDMKGSTAMAAVTLDALQAAAHAAGYDEAIINAMIKCAQ